MAGSGYQFAPAELVFRRSHKIFETGNNCMLWYATGKTIYFFVAQRRVKGETGKVPGRG